MQLPWTITLPFPDAKLHAHASGTWQNKVKPVRAARQRAFLEAIAKGKPVSIPSKIEYRIYVPDNRKRDAANIVQMCKPYVDGLVDAKVLPNDDWQSLSIAGVYVAIDRELPRVELWLY